MNLTTTKGKSIISVSLVDGRLEIVERQKSKRIKPTYPPKPAPDSVYKHIYEAMDGKIVFKETIQGIHTPAKTIPEQIYFE